MKRIFSLISVFVLIFAVAACGGKKKVESKEKPVVEEEVSVEIAAKEGGKIENSDKTVSIEIPEDALESDTKITMKIYDAKGYPGTEGKTVVSKVVEFEPSGIVFEKPVIISMISTGGGELTRAVQKTVVTAGVYREEKGEWSYSPTGAAVKIDGQNEKGDPIMTSAAGDPIMLNAAGDPIMQSADGGDPIMLSAAGDPIMVTAAGDPIMNAAAGDPIMMTTGHFTAYTFFLISFEEEEEPVEVDDEITDSDDDIDISDIEISDEDEDIDIPENDEDETPDVDEDPIVPEPELPVSRVVCTGMTICTHEEGYQILCPEEGEPFYGQDAQYAARGACVPGHSYEEIVKPPMIENDFTEVHDSATGLTWLFTGVRGTYEGVKNGCNISYDGKEDWRLPTPKEILTFTQNDRTFQGMSVDPILFQPIIEDGGESYWYGIYLWSSLENYVYALEGGEFIPPAAYGYSPQCFVDGVLLCVSGEEYGKVKAGNYTTVTKNGEDMVFDSAMNLYWQKETAKAETWGEALAYCENLEYAGASDWRLPNRNELVTLVDYSKIKYEPDDNGLSHSGIVSMKSVESGIPSLFPGMTADIFWSSTGAGDGYKWVVDMKDGVFYSFDGHSAGGYYSDTRSSESAISVRCVRSHLDAKTDFPACSKTGTAPCKDADGTIWSSAIYFLYSNSLVGPGNGQCLECKEGDRSDGISWYEVAETCRYLNEKGSRKWRLPTIDEIRSIVTAEKLKTGGSCGVTDECPGNSCFSEEACTEDEPSQTLLYDFGAMLSGTFNLATWDEENEASPELWALDTAYGFITAVEDEIPVYELVQRCVLDETLEFHTTPYTDPATGLTWSEDSHSYLNLSEAKKYCYELSKGDSEHWWRVPAIDELKTLVRNCDNADGVPCPVDVSGKYSPFRDLDDLLAVDSTGENFYTIYFTDAQIYENPSWGGVVRCVADNGPNPCADDPCREVAHSDGVCSVVGSGVERTYECGCPAPYHWTGSECISICSTNPCGSVPHSTGICMPKSDTEYECGCASGLFWSGSECVNPCAANPCEAVEHATECIPNTATEYECVCEETYAWTGSRCASPCDTNPCTAFGNSDGVCTAETEKFYRCGCVSGYYWWGTAKGCTTEQPTFGRICTSQFRCYDEHGEIECPAPGEDFYGQDANKAFEGVCAPKSFTIVGTGIENEDIVRDNNLGLEWMRKPDGSRDYDWYDALSYCSSLSYGGYDDWRVPTPKEYLSIVDNGRTWPSLNTKYFDLPDIPEGSYFDYDSWTSQKDINSNNYWFWAVEFDSGVLENIANNSTKFVRCVRGDTMPESSFVIPEEFAETEEKIVVDTLTGLQWQYADADIQDGGSFWKGGMDYCENLEYAGFSDWRLPNKDELMTLVNLNAHNPASSFPDLQAVTYLLTSTTMPNSSRAAFRVYLPDGSMNTTMTKYDAGVDYHVHCVRSRLGNVN